MTRSLFILALFPICTSLYGQTGSLIQPLSGGISETSGLIIIDGRFITHNDSGGDAALYEIDTTSGNIARTVVLNGVENTDWEDITRDETYIYVGDIGNNPGNRTDLRIHRIAISDYINTPTDAVNAETIFYSYEDQTNFPNSTFTTNFDGEAMVAIDGSIFIFTKNWGNQFCDIYQLPATPGTHSAINMGNLNPQGLITGADYNLTNGHLTLLGHSIFLQPFVIDILNFDNGEFDSFQKTNFALPGGYSGQAEAIAQNNGSYYITSEASFAGQAGLYSLPATYTIDTEELNEPDVRVYPNPAIDKIFIDYSNFVRAEVRTITGELLLSSQSSEIDIEHLSEGIYILTIWNKLNNQSKQVKFAVVQ